MSSDSQACDRCHRRKTKCDKLRPCSSCAKAGIDCVYTEKSKEPVYRRDFVERLERRTRQLEAANRALTERLASAREQRQHSTSNTSNGTPRELLNTEDVRTSNDIANEVSFLSTSAGGDRQFLGSTSGLLFANLVRASVVTTRSRESNGTVSALSTLGGDGSLAQGKPDWTIDDGNLLPPQPARKLIEAYLAHDHLSYPCLHPESVRSAVDSIYNESSFYRTHPFEAFMFNMLLAIGTSQIHKFNWQALPDAETHHLRAMLHLNAVLCEGGMKALQAMLLLCQFRLSSSTKDTSGSLWHLVGIAARMCFELGLHRESVYRMKREEQNNSRDDSSISKFEEQEVRRRCFWCVFALDRVVSITLGRPLAICSEDVDVELPSFDIDDALTPSVISSGDEQDLSRVGPNSRTAIFVHIVRYRALCGKFLTSLYRGSRNTASPEELRRIRNELAAELEAWRADTDSLNLPEMDLSSPLAEARSSFRSKAWHELIYHNAILLLYRPTPMLSQSDASGDDGNLQHIFNAAKESITLYAYLFRSRKINFSWMVLHAVFMAGLSYVYAVSRHIREKRRCRISLAGSMSMLTRDPTIVEIVNDCRACSNVLVAVSERCNAQKNCHEVFDRLSDALLADARKRSPSAQMAACMKVLQSYLPPKHILRHRQVDSNDTLTSAYGNPITPGQQMPYSPPLAADSALRDCFPDLQRMYDAQWGDDAILQLGMDWLEDINPGNGVLMGETFGGAFI
ncbi:hypothetical protein NA57DRAFT_67175 [Rhizodiscina lignyota]|uniref:Zn(2)-C6 fungal-type domain-containing protein n=1 Tax=Rhizodiscina lignyota TaxID=1504668 RepID=A0A9P4M840_9PEZI|nr:hypothetical protein NA57DRAFT_67175 [Rhizodiscina lignyota]